MGLSPRMEILEDTISVFSLYLNNAGGCVLTLHSPLALQKPVYLPISNGPSNASGHVQVTQGMLFDLMDGRACVPWSHGTITVGERALGRLPCTEHYTDRRLKQLPVFL